MSITPAVRASRSAAVRPRRHEVEVDARIVAELHQHEGVAAGQDARLVEDHRASSRLDSVQSASMARRAAWASATETRRKR